MDTFVTADDLARSWRVNRSSVLRWCNSGFIDAIKVGSRWIIYTPSTTGR